MADAPPPIRILIADDHALFRQGVRRLLDAAPELQVVGEAASGHEALRLVEELAPDIVLLDVSMPGPSGIEVARVIKTTSPRSRVIILTVFTNEEFLFEAIKAGAMGYLLKDSSPEELLRAIRVVAEGEGLIAPAMAAKIFKEFARATEDIKEVAPLVTPLTQREVEILQHVAAGIGQQGDRGEPGHQRAHGEEPSEQHHGETPSQQPDAGGRVRPEVGSRAAVERGDPDDGLPTANPGVRPVPDAETGAVPW